MKIATARRTFRTMPYEAVRQLLHRYTSRQSYEDAPSADYRLLWVWLAGMWTEIGVDSQYFHCEVFATQRPTPVEFNHAYLAAYVLKNWPIIRRIVPDVAFELENSGHWEIQALLPFPDIFENITVSLLDRASRTRHLPADDPPWVPGRLQ